MLGSPQLLQHANSSSNLLHPDISVCRVRSMETRTASVGDCSRVSAFRSPKTSTFRRRSTRRRISNAQRLADLEEYINKQVQASDGNFFERITAPVEQEERIDEELCTIKNLSIHGDRKIMEALYTEALYTIAHKVGKEEGESQENLYKYVRSAFQGDLQLHNSLMERAKKTKPPVILLNVLLLEAKDLIAKDVNGFSDPFAMMGVVPGTRNSTDSQKPPVAFDERGATAQSKQKDGVLQRFGGSFRRKVRKEKNGDESSIPAKLIKASSVQKRTLNPKWNEKFQFAIEDVNADRFHMDIWDHDDEEQSVLDAVSTLNQISGGLKGLGRYFKEVAQSARAHSDDSTDDFLGCINVYLKDIPSEGMEKWFILEPRSERSKVYGQVKLKMWLSTKEDRIGDEEDLLDVKEHIELLRQFALHEIRQSGYPVRMWDGHFPDKPTAILKQHAIQGDLTEVQTTMCKWLAFHSLIPIDISFTLLYQTLQSLLDKWRPMILEKEEENILLDSLHNFDSLCKKMMVEHRERFAPTKRNSGEEYSSLIKCMKTMRESSLFQKFMPFKRPFSSHLESLIVKSAEEYFHKMVERVEDEDPCRELLRLLSLLNNTCSRFLHFSAVIRETTRIDYSQLTLSTFDKMLEEYLTSEMMSERKTDLRTQMRIAASQEPPSDDDLIDLIKIHMAFVELRNYRLANKVRIKDDSEWAVIFDRGVKNFLEVARERALARVQLACQLDVPIWVSSNDMRHSSSHIDVCHIVEQMTVAWEHMDVSDLLLKIEYTIDLVEMLCETVSSYTKKVIAQLEAEGLTVEQLQTFVPSTLLTILCSAINNCEQVRRSLMVHDKLHIDDIALKFEKEREGDPSWKAELECKLSDCDGSVCKEIDRIIDLLTRRLYPQMKKHVFHLAWSPAACPVEEAIKPLTDMLDIELSAVHRQLLHKNFLRVMGAQVAIVVQLLNDCVDENTGMEPTFYQRLFESWGVLVDFFHAGGKGISMEVLETTPSHIALVKKLSLTQTPTDQLIEKYYKDLLRQQNEVAECKYGILNLRAYYNGKSQTLVLDVIGAKQVIALDSNGLSDPFVVIELVPKFRYPLQPVMKTKVVSKSLNPIFDETFEFHIPAKLPPSAMLHLTVMDHDYLRSNDFAGEAFLELTEVPGFGGNGASTTLRQFNLVLIHPVSTSKELIEVLESRKDDKDAVEFLRSVSTSY